MTKINNYIDSHSVKGDEELAPYLGLFEQKKIAEELVRRGVRPKIISGVTGVPVQRIYHYSQKVQGDSETDLTTRQLIVLAQMVKAHHK